MTPDRLTCLVPTHNRPQFLRRLLSFYSQVPPGFSFVVLDSSRPSAAAENLAAVEGSKRHLDLQYRHLDQGFFEKCARGLEQVRTPFVVLCADDDLLFPDPVRHCVDFLGNQPDFVAAIGRSAMLHVKYPRWCKVLKGCSIDDVRPLERCRTMATTPFFNFFYGVYRTAALCHNFQITAAYSESMPKYHFPFTMLEQLSVLHGRFKVLPVMYSLREYHGTNLGAEIPTGMRPDPELYYQHFRGCLTQQLAGAGIDRSEAERFIDDSYSRFRKPDMAFLRPRRTAIEVIQHLFYGAKDRVADYFWTDDTRHRRFVRSSDIKGCEQVWHAATKIMRDFPLGIPSDHSTSERCA